MTTSCPDRAARPPGFTLVELLVVVTVAAALLVAAAGISRNGGGQGLELGELQVRDALEFARSQALATRAPVGVVFDPPTDRFAVVDEAGGVLVDPLAKAGYLVDFARPNQPRGLSIQSASFGAMQTAIVFDAQGVPVSGGSVTLAHGGATRTLAVDAATGAVTSS